MHGCGMAIINPPYQLDDVLKAVMPELLRLLRRADAGETRVYWLSNTPEGER
jgi:23S rRNA A2030 N6-methylase RlmJ